MGRGFLAKNRRPLEIVAYEPVRHNFQAPCHSTPIARSSIIGSRRIFARRAHLQAAPGTNQIGVVAGTRVSQAKQMVLMDWIDAMAFAQVPKTM
jgi:hypothetical protein